MPYVGSPGQKAAQRENIKKALAARHKPVSDAEYIERIKAKCSSNEKGCWLFGGSKNTWGYGQISYRNKRWMVHRLVYTLKIGPIPPDGDHGRSILCHTCDEPACVNPYHMWVGTEKDNMKDAARKKRWPRQHKTHCKRGHPLSGDNLRINKTMRQCVACERGRHRVEIGWPEDLAYTLPTQPLGYTINPNHRWCLSLSF